MVLIAPAPVPPAPPIPQDPADPADPADLARLAAALLASARRPAPRDLLLPPGEQASAGGAGAAASASAPSLADLLVSGPVGLGTAASRVVAPVAPAPPDALGEPQRDEGGTELYCPPAVRDDVALGELTNEALVAWAGEVGIYPDQLDKVRAANFGRLMMLTHPACTDPDRLLAAAKCVLAEWATDDHFLDDESLGADAAAISSRLGITYAAIDPVDLPAAYAPQLQAALDAEPVARAYQSAFEHLGRFATPTQVARLHHELGIMFMAYSHEADWRRSGRTPPVWEYLTHRHENSFLPPMVLVDPLAGYEVPAHEFADRRVRRCFCLAGSASVILNDLYSMAKESDADFDLPKVIAAEEHCSIPEAIERAVVVHNELMHTYEREAAALSAVGSPALTRFLTDVWAWLGGNREWHATTLRYQVPAT
ncbi:MAG TPA: family 2 encapsulin nanocompartment cargo protein terpene cyclase [Actinomycetota bacterium]|nr:family 2 encapsulin nanocompartment cargo protein terpene cyclase [Actinomycetota bacterium]